MADSPKECADGPPNHPNNPNHPASELDGLEGSGLFRGRSEFTKRMETGLFGWFGGPSERYNRSHAISAREDDPFLEKEQEFTPEQLCKKVESLGYELAVVIDLTFTFRYYNGVEELSEKHDVQYEKVKCEGKRVPNEQVIKRVCNIISDVIHQHGRDSKKLVGLHCTHGVNRAGYVLCRYLIDFLGYEPEKAIAAFNASRGHEMERPVYIEDLKSRTPKTLYEEWKENKVFFRHHSFRETAGGYDRDIEQDVYNWHGPDWHWRQNDYFRRQDERNYNRHRPYRRRENYRYNSSDYYTSSSSDIQSEDAFYHDEFPTDNDFVCNSFSNDQLLNSRKNEHETRDGNTFTKSENKTNSVARNSEKTDKKEDTSTAESSKNT